MPSGAAVEGPAAQHDFVVSHSCTARALGRFVSILQELLQTMRISPGILVLGDAVVRGAGLVAGGTLMPA